jgi:hypothetical protein
MEIQSKSFVNARSIGLTIVEYIYCKAIAENDRDIIKTIDTNFSKEVRRSLLAKDYIDDENRLIDHVKVMILKEDSYDAPKEVWNEFKRIYPKSTPNDRKLHTNLPVAKRKYEKITKNNRKLHEKILTLLKKEIKERTEQNTLNYLSGISKYINQRMWEGYEIEDDEANTNIEPEIL